MLLLPGIILALSGISGAGGLALSAKSLSDTMQANATNRQTQLQNEKNVYRFHAVSEVLDASLKDLGNQRWMISKNFKAFVNAFEVIRNRPSFSDMEDLDFPEFEFDEIKDVSVVAESVLGSSLGALGGTALAAAATTGITNAMMALGTASTGIKIKSLSGAAAVKATYAALGGGSLATNGGGILLGKIVLGAASVGVGLLFEGVAMAYVSSKTLKQADETHQKMLDNEKLINEIIQIQLDIAHAADDMKRVSVEICNNIYKPFVLEMKELVARKQDYNEFTDEEMSLVENTILVVQVLHYLNTTPLYKVIKTNEEGEAEEIEPNFEVKSAIKSAQSKVNHFLRG